MATKKTEIIVTVNSKQSEMLLKKMEEELKRVTAEYKKLVAAGKGESDQAKALKKEMNDLNAAIKQNQANVNRVKAVMDNLSGATMRQLKSALREVKKQMDGMSASNPKLRELKTQYNAITKQINQLNSGLVGVNGNLKNQDSAWKKTLKSVTSYMGVTMIIGKIQQMLTSVLRLNMKFSDQLADIRKVSGLAMKDINELSGRLAKIDTRTTIEELNQIAYAGAKLGIGKYGVEGLEGFVRAANQVNVALKEDLGADALTALSKITEVMGLIPKMGVEKSMLATGSAMFQLSATSTATSNNIVEFAKRLTGMARTAGITTDQLLALGSAADSMYLMPEVASTAFNKFISALQTNHNLIEKQLEIEPGTIAKLYEAGKIVDAMVLVFEKMKEKGNMNALKPIFKDLGSDGARLVNVMVTMSKNVDMLKDHLYVSEEAFKEAMAVTNEYNIQQETAQALMERASNVWEKAFVNPDGVDNVKKMAQAWYDMTKTLTQSTFYMGSMKVVLWLVLTGVKLLIALLPTLISLMLFKGVVAAVMSAVTAYKALTASIKAATAAQQKFNLAQKANAVVTFASILATAIAYLWEYAKAANKAGEAQKSVNDYVHEAELEYQKESAALRSYISALDDASLSQKERERLLSKLNREYRPYLDYLGIEIKSVQDLKDNYSKLNAEIRNKMYWQLRDKAVTDLVNTDTEDGESLATKKYKAMMDYNQVVTAKPSHKAFDMNWLEDQMESGLDADAIVQKIMASEYGGIKKERGVNLTIDPSKPPKEQTIYTGFKRDENGNLDIKGDRVDITSNYETYLKYVQKVISTDADWRAKLKEIYDAFGDIHDPFKEENPGSLENEATDKDALKAAKAAAAARKKTMREELKQAQDEARAIIDNIKNFYQRQITEVLKTANEQGWDEALVQSATDAILARENLALSQARKGIAGVKNEWDDFKQTMNKDMVETADEVGYNESQVLLDLIQANNISALHDKISSLERDLEMPTNAATDAIWKNASLNEQANETAEQRHIKERQKIMLQDNYTGKVNDQYSSSMTRLGYFDIDENQANTLIAGGEDAEALLDKRSMEIAQLFKRTRENITKLIDIQDVSTADGRSTLLEILFGPDWENGEWSDEWDNNFTTLKEIYNLAGDDIKQFYMELIKYNDDYVEAEKKAEERAKKLADFQWGRSSTKNRLDDKERTNALYSQGILQHVNLDEYEKKPMYGMYGNGQFMSQFGVDPEIESYRLKIEAAKEYYDFLKAHGVEGQTLRDQETAAIEAQQEYVMKMASNIKSQMEALYELHQPIMDFGLAAGDAFATMTKDAEAGRDALRAAVGDMINSFLKQTVQMTQEYVKRRILQKSHDRLTSIEAAAHEAEMTNIQSMGDSTRLSLHQTMQTGITSIDAEQSAERQVTNQVENATTVTSDMTAASAETTIGIASGAAKTIGKLGWWGIPLVAVITALLNALLGAAMSKVSSLFGGKSSTENTTRSRLVSGMLTYDSGNVQAFRGIEDGKTYPVVGDDGKVYAATDAGELETGLVKDPITTWVNGQPALVAERGPEMVIGRETTAAMMMARPDILAEIVKFDRQRSGRTYRAFDAGNVDSFDIGNGSNLSAEDAQQLRDTISNLSMVLSALQKNGITARINKYGRGGVAEAAESGRNFLGRNSGDRIWNG